MVFHLKNHLNVKDRSENYRKYQNIFHLQKFLYLARYSHLVSCFIFCSFFCKSQFFAYPFLNIFGWWRSICWNTFLILKISNGSWFSVQVFIIHPTVEITHWWMIFAQVDDVIQQMTYILLREGFHLYQSVLK